MLFLHWIIRWFLKISIPGETLHGFVISSFVSDPSETKRDRLLPLYGVNSYILQVICRGFFEKTNFMLVFIPVHELMFVLVWILYSMTLICSARLFSKVSFFFNLIFRPFSFTPLYTCIWVMHWEELRHFIVEWSSNCPPASQPLLLFLCRGYSLSSMWNYNGIKYWASQTEK